MFSCIYSERLARLTRRHYEGYPLTGHVLAAHARWALNHWDQCANAKSIAEWQFLHILAKGDLHGAYAFLRIEGALGPQEEDDLGQGRGCGGSDPCGGAGPVD